jgi:hypothetical protein
VVVGSTLIQFRLATPDALAAPSAQQIHVLHASGPQPHTAAATAGESAKLVAEDGSVYQIGSTTVVLGRTPEQGRVEADCLLGNSKLLSRRHAVIAVTGHGSSQRRFWLTSLARSGRCELARIGRPNIQCSAGMEPIEVCSLDRILLPTACLTFIARSSGDSIVPPITEAAAASPTRVASAKLTVEQKAAEQIQNAFRSRLLAAQLARAAEAERWPQIDAAQSIQAAWRGSAVRKSEELAWARQQQRTRGAATLLQSAWRGFVCRADLVERADDLLMELAERRYWCDASPSAECQPRMLC